MKEHYYFKIKEETKDKCKTKTKKDKKKKRKRNIFTALKSLKTIKNPFVLSIVCYKWIPGFH
jgi:hypothetical protein